MSIKARLINTNNSLSLKLIKLLLDVEQKKKKRVKF